MNKRYIRYKKKKFPVHIFFIILLFVLSAFIFTKVDKIYMRTVITASELQIKTKINRIIDSSVKKCIKELNLAAGDFLISKTDDKGKLTAISANTLLINELCSLVAVSASEDLTGIEKENIRVPLGAFSGIAGFSNIGPDMSFKVLPVGTAEVDYETKFSSTGINQVHFQIFLNVNTTVRIVNPFQQSEIKLFRKLILVDTVISGEIPQNIFGGFK